MSTEHERGVVARVAASTTAMAVLVVGYTSTPSAAQQLVPAPVRTAPHASTALPQHAPSIPPQGPTSKPKSLQQLGVPLQLSRDVIPSGNPQTPEKIALGERLFFDGRLSADGSVACATCHDPRRAFSDGLPTSVGIGGLLGRRNAPTIMNALYEKRQFWDGRVGTLEQQALLPIINPLEMGEPSLAAPVAEIAKDPEYRAAFQRAFGRAPDATDLARAIAAYERTQIAYDTPFDHFIAGDRKAISDDAQRGWQLFNTRGRCNKCHARDEKVLDPTNFTDNDFHNIGVGIVRHDVVALARRAEEMVASTDKEAVDKAAIQTDMSALGRFLITTKPADMASFKTPNLRNVLVTAPYFHDGSQQTLWDVVDHYNKGAGLHDPWLDEDIQPLALSEHDIDDLVAFMASLTSPEYAGLARTELARQRLQAALQRPQRDTKRAFGPKPPRPTAAAP
jgi:cytochrome c peroxidase